MTKFKNVFLLAAMAVSALCVSSCEKEDENTADGSFKIVATGITLPAGVEVDEVRAIIGNSEPFVTAPYANGGFTLTLPATLPAGQPESQMPADITLTPTGVKIYSINNAVTAYKNGEKVGVFTAGPEGITEGAGASFTYFDKAGSVNGTGVMYDISFHYDKLSFTQGWNKIYYTPTTSAGAVTVNFTLKEPTGGVKWEFHGR